ncbi:MAG: SufD family Fe-S cluster assembly protein [bacterium]
MYLTKAQFITQNSFEGAFIIGVNTEMALVLDNEFLESGSKIILEQNSSLELIIIQDKNSQNIAYRILQKKNSRLKVFVITSSKNCNLQILQEATEANASFELFGISFNLATSSSTIDLQSLIKQPNCDINIVFNNTIAGSAKCNFSGIVNISKNAQNANVHLVNKNLLLSDNCKINSKPILQIFNPNVKAKHAATTGFLKDKELIYLQSRGLTKERASKILVQAFNQQIINKLNIICFRDRFNQILNQNG